MNTLKLYQMALTIILVLQHQYKMHIWGITNARPSLVLHCWNTLLYQNMQYLNHTCYTQA